MLSIVAFIGRHRRRAVAIQYRPRRHALPGRIGRDQHPRATRSGPRDWSHLVNAHPQAAVPRVEFLDRVSITVRLAVHCPFTLAQGENRLVPVSISCYQPADSPRRWTQDGERSMPGKGDTVDKLAKWRTVKISDFDFARDGWLQKASVRAQAAPGRKFGFFDRSLRLKNAWCGSVGKKFQAEFSRPSLSTVSGGYC